MSKIKSVSTYDGSSWGTAVPLGADDVNVDITSATTSPTVSSSTAAELTTATDVIVASGDTNATAWTKFNRFRNRVTKTFGNYIGGSVQPSYNATGSNSTFYPTSVINNYMKNVIGLTGTSTPTINGSAQTVASALSSLNDNIIRPNLLDNWYFVGGGSQSGNGVFPINQRGQTSYSTKGYGIDRWYRSTVAAGNILVNANGLTASTNLFIRQANDIQPQLIGKTLTFSVLWKNAGLSSITHVFEDGYRFTASSVDYTKLVYSYGLTVLPHELVGLFVTPSDYIIAIKLEVGDTSTLAHKEGDIWVLNELPDYQTELQKCLGYYYKTSNTTAIFGSGIITGSAKRVIMNFTVPVPFVRSISSVSMQDYTLRLGTSGYSALTPNETYIQPESLSVLLPSKYSTSVRVTDLHKDATGDPNNSAIIVAARGLEISCEPVET